MKKELVVVFSIDGHALRRAQALATTHQADLLQLEAPHMPQGFFKYLVYGYKALYQKDVELKPYTQDVSEYEKLTLVAPIHAGRVCSPIVTFLKQNLGKLPPMDLVLTHAAKDDDYASSAEALKKSLNISFDHFESHSI